MATPRRIHLLIFASLLLHDSDAFNPRASFRRRWQSLRSRSQRQLPITAPYTSPTLSLLRLRPFELSIRPAVPDIGSGEIVFDATEGDTEVGFEKEVEDGGEGTLEQDEGSVEGEVGETTTTENSTLKAEVNVDSKDASLSEIADAVSLTKAEHPAALDKSEIGKYFVATALQFGFMAALLIGLDCLASSNGYPGWAVGILFAFLSLRSRHFSFLDSSRPNRAKQGGAATPTNVKRPAWTPPGVVFPLIWLTITVLRATSASMVYRAAGSRLFSLPLLCLVGHLAVGDTWNTITNIEKRLGVSASACGIVAVSVYAAVYAFYGVSPLAGLILAPSALWISVACFLTMEIWKLNEPRESLVPRVGDGKASKWGVDYSILGPMTSPIRKVLANARSNTSASV